jgi:ABC-2 type transport system permease protein
MNKSLTIAWREFIEIVRTRVFLITSVLLPAGIVGLVLATEPIIESLQNEKVEVRKIAILDHTGIIATGMIERAEAYNERNPNRPLEFIDQSETSVDDLRQAVLDGEYYAYMELPHGVLDGSSAGNLGRKDNQISVQRAIRDHLNETLRIARGDLAEPKIPYQTVLQIMQPVGLQSIDLTTGESKGGSQMASFMMPFAFMFLLFMGTMGISQHLLTSLIEEKNTRVIEVLLSAVSPLQLMAGKIAGISAVGMLLLAIWGCLGYFTARWQDMAYLVETRDLVHAGIYFLPTFLLFAGMLGAIGSTCNTLKDAQSMTTPLTIMTIIPMMMWFPISENPNSMFSIGASFVPIISSFVMILRLTSTPEIPLWQVLVTQLLLWAQVIFIIWAAAKVFRTGILMYGKPPNLREMLTWLRQA